MTHNQEQGEIQQSFGVGYSLLNKVKNQRIVVLGDSSFLSNSAINNYANHQLSLNLISWLTMQSVVPETVTNRDNYIQMTPWVNFIFTWLFSTIIPMMVLLFMLYFRLKHNGKLN